MIQQARREALSKLKSNAELVALVPAARIYGQAVPANTPWPFIRFGPTSGTLFTASCTRGEQLSFPVHGFAKARVAGSAIVETAEDHACRIGAALVNALHNRLFDDGTVNIAYRISDQSLDQDTGEADAFHFFATVNARVIRE